MNNNCFMKSVIGFFFFGLCIDGYHGIYIVIIMIIHERISWVIYYYDYIWKDIMEYIWQLSWSFWKVFFCSNLNSFFFCNLFLFLVLLKLSKYFYFTITFNFRLKFFHRNVNKNVLWGNYECWIIYYNYYDGILLYHGTFNRIIMIGYIISWNIQ